MLGPPKPRRLDQPIAVSLEDLLPQNNFYRHLEAKLDLSFVRDWVRELYAERGRPSIDPVIFFKLQLVMFFEGIRSERKLIATASLNLAHRWYLGYALDEDLPDHSSLTRIRQRLGIGIFERFFEKVVGLCQDAGLVWGRELFFDATRVRADADTDSLVPRFYHEAKAHVADISTDPPRSTDEPSSPPGDSLLHLPVETEGTESAPRESGVTRWNLLDERRLAPGRPSHRGYRRTSDFRVSTTDPDASPMPYGEKGTRLGYQDHYVVDGGRARIILTALVTPAEVQENQPALDLLWRVRFRWKLWPRQVTGDTKYGTSPNIAAIEQQQMRAYFPLSEVGHRAGQFGDEDFVYDAAADTYSCPGGQTLRFLSQCQSTQRRIYAAPAGVCRTCALRDQCTTAQRGRRVGRHRDESYLDRVRAYHATEPYAKAMRKRKVWVEPLFAEAKDWHGLRRFRLRGLEKVNGEALLIATGQNLKRLLSRRGWGRRPFPSGAAAAVLAALQPTAVVAP